MIGPNLISPLEALSTLWPAALTIAIVVLRDGRAERRRRECLNERLHELRRPLQILALAQSKRERGLDPLELALHALRDLDRAINGAPASQARRQTIDARRLVDEAASRWRARAALSARPLRVRWLCDSALVEGDRHALAQALDNLIANSIAHGRGPITLLVTPCEGAVQIVVRDAGTILARRRVRDRDPRHGHGLRVANRVAVGHGGSLELRPSQLGVVAALRLPIARGRPIAT